MQDNLATEIVILPATLARCASWYAGGRDPAEPGIAPLFGTFEGFPPTLVQVSASEVLYDDATRFVDRARAAGVDVTAEVETDLWHVWQTMAPTVPEARFSIDSAAGFVAGRTRAA
jgi:acetyl esterase/lipase